MLNAQAERSHQILFWSGSPIASAGASPTLFVQKLFLVALLGTSACAGHTKNLVWHDEFNGPAGGSFDRAKWVADTGGAGFGNKEREFYTTRPENAALDGNG